MKTNTRGIIHTQIQEIHRGIRLINLVLINQESLSKGNTIFVNTFRSLAKFELKKDDSQSEYARRS